MSIPDNYDQWLKHEREQTRWLKSRPKCSRCGEHIQSEKCYRIHGEVYCPDCIEDFAEEVDGYE